MNWTTIKAAIHAWVQTASGYAADRVVWGRQPNAPTRTRPFIEMSVTGMHNPGIDGVHVSDNPTPSAGAEILHTAQGPRTALLTLTCYAQEGTGSASAVAVLTTVMAKAGLPLAREALDTAGVGLGEESDVLGVDGLLNVAAFEPRATVSVRLHLASEVSETGTYIEHVEHEGEVTGFGE